MDLKKTDFQFIAVEDIYQENVVALELAVRALKTEDAKPLLRETIAAMAGLSAVEHDVTKLVGIISKASEYLFRAIKILDANETLTASSDRSVSIKAASNAGWILAPELTADDVDKFRPSLAIWANQKIWDLYTEAMRIDPN